MFNLSDDAVQQALKQAGSPDGTNGAAVVGSNGRTIARFFMHATKDGEASERAGRTIYRQVPFVEVRAEGATDSASHAVTDDVKKKFPAEWAQFQEQQVSPVHSVMALPGFTACDFRYCDDAEIFTIERLATAQVQPELERLQNMARRWLALLNEPEGEPKRKPGRPKGSRNKPKEADAHVGHA